PKSRGSPRRFLARMEGWLLSHIQFEQTRTHRKEKIYEKNFRRFIVYERLGRKGGRGAEGIASPLGAGDLHLRGHHQPDRRNRLRYQSAQLALPCDHQL